MIQTIKSKNLQLKIEKIVGLVLFVVGVFSVLKLLNILEADLIIPAEYLVWFTAVACVFFGFILMVHTQRGIS